MGLHQKNWARATRLKLRRLLGMKCAGCGSKFYAKLEFDCIKPCGHWHHKIEWSHRMSFYRQQFALGNLQLLCGGQGGCHGKKSANEL